VANIHEIRADYDRATLVVYQAYCPAIADAALDAQRFVPPFSFTRMTWIKPSFLWLMHRSNWGQKSGQERTLAVRISRSTWEETLSLAVLTTPKLAFYDSAAEWQAQFRQAQVVVQWDPERSLRGNSLPCRSIQVGLSRRVIRRYAQEWIVGIEDYSGRVGKIHRLLRAGQADKAQQVLPPERVYPLRAALARRINADR
jgi:hypothetical protein